MKRIYFRKLIKIINSCINYEQSVVAENCIKQLENIMPISHQEHYFLMNILNKKRNYILTDQLESYKSTTNEIDK